MTQAADTVEYDAERLSFMRSIRAIRRQVNGLAGFPPDDLITAVNETIAEITEYPNPPRRHRTYPRVVKRYKPHRHPTKQPKHKGARHAHLAKINIFNLALT